MQLLTGRDVSKAKPGRLQLHTHTPTRTPLAHRHRYSKDDVAIRPSSSGFIQAVGRNSSQVRNSCFLKHLKQFENCSKVSVPFFSSEFTLIFSFSIMCIYMRNVQRGKLSVSTYHDRRASRSWIHEEFSFSFSYIDFLPSKHFIIQTGAVGGCIVQSL